MAKYVQNNSPYFLAVFFGIQKKRQSRFSFSAFLFSGGWLLYRKIYKIGAIITGLMLALFLTNTIVSAYFSTPLLLGLYEQAGVSVTAYPSYEELMRITELVYQLDAGSIFLLFTPLITLSLQFSVMLYCGFNANRLYYRHCVDNIRTIKARNLEADVYEQTLVETGGVNISLALSLFNLLFADYLFAKLIYLITIELYLINNR